MMEVSWCLIFSLLININQCFGQNKNNGITFYYNNNYKYNEEYTVEVSKNTEYIMEFAGDLVTYDTPARVTVASDFANRTYPLFVTARQQKGVFSWQLPMLVQTPDSSEQFTNISRTLCPHNNIFSEDEDACDVPSLNIPIVHLTSSSPDPIKVTIFVETVKDFFIQQNSVTNLTSTPSQPKYYFYPFDQGPNRMVDIETQSIRKKYMCNKELDVAEQGKLERYFVKSNSGSSAPGWLSRSQSVIVMIESDDDVCAVVSIQNFSCPVFDNERDILYDGFYLTMTRRGGITLTQDSFPYGFYIVFIVKTSDEACYNNTAMPKMAAEFGWGERVTATAENGRVKTFSFSVVPTISYSQYLLGAAAPLGFFLSFYVAFAVAVVCQRRRPAAETELLVSPETPHDVSVVTPPCRRRVVNDASCSSAGDAGERPGDGPGVCSSSSDTESDVSTVEINTDQQFRVDGRLCVAHLARCRPRVLSSRSRMYLWGVLTVAVFYTLPVIQLVVTYQRLLNQSGNQDLCYFNFLCAHPLGSLSDFNHVYSNVGYILLGTLFLLQVRRRHLRAEAKGQADVGIPQHWGLLYALGVSLLSEGLLSAAYHVCPNSMNFQFDTSFMYVTSVLCMVKIYQSRHADINARAHATFGVLALIIFIGLVGVLNANFYFWVLFTVLHLVTCLILTFQIYYLGRFKFDLSLAGRGCVSLLRGRLPAPAHCGRGVLLLLANISNWAVAAYGLSQHSRDFASHLLLVLMSNLFLYTLFYIVMKLLHRESIRWYRPFLYSWVFIFLTYSVWFGSSYFYLDLSTNWALSPAQSRRHNRVCSLLQLFDSHDSWHFLSSIAMFFSFNMYLTIDDNLNDVPRTEIMVF